MTVVTWYDWVGGLALDPAPPAPPAGVPLPAAAARPGPCLSESSRPLARPDATAARGESWPGSGRPDEALSRRCRRTSGRDRPGYREFARRCPRDGIRQGAVRLLASPEAQRALKRRRPAGRPRRP